MKESHVTLYVVPNCPLCSHARTWLEDNRIDYIERDVANDFGSLRAMYTMTKQDLVPVIESDGHALVRPSENELTKLLL